MDADFLPKDARRPAPRVHVVTAEEAAAQQFGIESVVLPLPGQEAVYPEHATAQARPPINRLFPGSPASPCSPSCKECPCWSDSRDNAEKALKKPSQVLNFLPPVLPVLTCVTIELCTAVAWKGIWAGQI